MSVARERAMFLREFYGVEGVLTDAGLDGMLTDRQITTVMSGKELLGPLPELFLRRRGYVLAGLSPEWRRWLKAELVAHFVLHEGDQTVLPLDFVAMQEGQATEAAGWLLWGDPAETVRRSYALTTRHLAAIARAPLSCVEQWWELARGQLMREPHYQMARVAHWSR